MKKFVALILAVFVMLFMCACIGESREERTARLERDLEIAIEAEEKLEQEYDQLEKTIDELAAAEEALRNAK